MHATLCNMSKAVVFAKLTYSSPTWWGFTTGHDQLKLEAVVHHVVAVDFCTSDHTALAKLAAATNLVIVFEQVLRDKQHAFPPTAARQNAD